MLALGPHRSPALAPIRKSALKDVYGIGGIYAVFCRRTAGQWYSSS